MTDTMMVELLKAATQVTTSLAWPTTVLILIWVFRRPLQAIAEQLPEKFSAASKVGVGMLSLEIAAQARAAGDPDLARRVGRLSPEATELLLNMRGSRRGRVVHHIESRAPGREPLSGYNMPSPFEMAVIAELEQLGLIKLSEPLDKFASWLASDRFVSVVERGRHLLYQPVAGFSKAEEDRLHGFSYEQTSKGAKASDAIWAAILNALNSPPSRDVRRASPANAESGEGQALPG
jgi:hypothetical protein